MRVNYKDGRAYVERNKNGELRRDFGEIHQCLFCKKQFFACDINIRQGWGRFCSRSCASKNRMGKLSSRWNGGITSSGAYILVHRPDHPYRNNHGYVREHRLVVEKIIGRHLLPIEEVHHSGTQYPIGTDKNKQDNRPENLIAFANKAAHRRFEKGKYIKPKEIIFDGRKHKTRGDQNGK